ncbi:MAG: hypothetical protein M3177_10705 [Pseudomonadota bacterium]|nr:hypothetical protein [Pseudomonadota bacterium]
MNWRTWITVAALLAGLWPAAARACSVTDEFVLPSNFELVQMAEAIVVASAEPQPKDGLPEVTFRTEAIVKGPAPERFNLSFASLGTAVPSDNEDLSAAHPESYGGPCNRTTFPPGGRFLIFLQRHNGAWAQLGMPFSRVNEDYSGEDNAWMRSVRRYLALQRSLPPMEQLAALARIAETGTDGEGRRLSASERDDVLSHLRSISPSKPTPWLLDIYARLERGDPLPFGPPDRSDNPEEGYDRAAAELLGEEWPEDSAGAALESAERAAGQGSRPTESPIDGLRLRVLRSLTLGRHPGALPLFERLWAAPETARRLRGVILRYFARNGQYPRAYRWIEDNLMAELRTLPRGEALALLSDVAEVQRGDSWEAGRERWRSDPHAAATWPALSRSINRYQVESFGEEYALPFYDLTEDDP